MILLRHGQSEFNLHFTATRRDPGIEDPHLTALGQEQAEAAAVALVEVDLSRLIVSPYTRTLQTAAPLLARRALTIEVEPLIRERFAFSCDVGSVRAVLAARFPDHDFAHLTEPWWADGFETEASVVARAAAFRDHMAARADEQETIVVSHWAFLLALTGESLGNGEMMEYDPRTPAPAMLRWRH